MMLDIVPRKVDLCNVLWAQKIWTSRGCVLVVRFPIFQASSILIALHKPEVDHGRWSTPRVYESCVVVSSVLLILMKMLVTCYSLTL